MSAISGGGNSPFAHLKKDNSLNSKLKIEELNTKAIQEAFGLKKEDPNTLLQAMKAICLDAGDTFNDLEKRHNSANDLINEIGRAHV